MHFRLENVPQNLKLSTPLEQICNDITNIEYYMVGLVDSEVYKTNYLVQRTGWGETGMDDF